MKTGIIGQTFSGKTTVFQALCGSSAPHGHGGINLATVKVPDERVDKLSALFNPKKTIHAVIDFADFGITIDAKAGLDAQTGAKIKEMDALALVVGAYKAESPAAAVSELRATIDELLLLDAVAIEKRLEKMQKDRGEKNPSEVSALDKCKAALEAERFISSVELTETEEKALAGFRFFTEKPFFAIINETESAFGKTEYPGLKDYCANKNIELFFLSAPIEVEISALAGDEQKAFLTDMGVGEPAAARFIRTVYAKLDLISFFTVGEDEVRAWTIERNTIAKHAAGKIHSDIEKGFIRAEVMRYEDLIALGSESKVKDSGKFRLEGKEYVVQDGDITHFRFNV